MIFNSNEAEKFGGIQNFCVIKKMVTSHFMVTTVQKSSENLTFDQTTMYNRVIGNVNSKQLVLGLE